MKAFFTRILQGFDYQTSGDWVYSLAPSFKYDLAVLWVGVSTVSSVASTLLGFDSLALAGLLVAMLVELVSGIWASRIKKEPFSSRRLSRFTFKSAVYLILIAIPYLFARSFAARGHEFASGIFDWFHIFLTVTVVLEHLVSILENMGVITGKDKTHWIVKLQDKADQILS